MEREFWMGDKGPIICISLIDWYYNGCKTENKKRNPVTVNMHIIVLGERLREREIH